LANSPAGIFLKGINFQPYMAALAGDMGVVEFDITEQAADND
jgi:hypothetical protein